MSKFNAEQHRIETASALDRIIDTEQEDRHAAYVGLDVHKETIAVAVAEPGRSEPVYRGEIANKPRKSWRSWWPSPASPTGAGCCCSATRPVRAATCSTVAICPVCPEPMCSQQRLRLPVDMWTSPHPCAARAEPCGQPMDRVRRRWSTPHRRAGAAHRLPTLSGLSPTYPQAQQRIVFYRESKRSATEVNPLARYSG
jgi:hypothetical protein